jgi:hypothetical protein
VIRPVQRILAIGVVLIGCRTPAAPPPSNIVSAAPLPVVESTSGTVTFEPEAIRRELAGIARQGKLLDGARLAMARGELASARAVLDDHAGELARGPLLDEVLDLYIELAVRSGDRARAWLLARRFFARYPQSRLLPHVRGMTAVL